MTVLLSDDEARGHAQSLHRARRDGVPIPPLTDGRPDLGMLDGYAVQQHLVRMLVDEGDVVAGYKLGLTSIAMQELLGVDSPDFGPVFASGILGDGAEMDPGRFIAPRIEAEVAVLLDRDLAGPGCTSAQALASSRGLIAALEIVDSRIDGWRIKLADTVADLASGGAIALSGLVVPVRGFDPRLVGMVLTRNGDMVATGAGAAALGDPLAAVAWLANTLAPMGVVLPAGSIVMTGALHAMLPVAPGDVFRADFDRLGPVTVRMRPQQEGA